MRFGLQPDHLKRVVSELTENDKTGIATCVYRGRSHEKLRLENGKRFHQHGFRATKYSGRVAATNALAPGATIAIKR